MNLAQNKKNEIREQRYKSTHGIKRENFNSPKCTFICANEQKLYTHTHTCKKSRHTKNNMLLTYVNARITPQAPGAFQS